jgi:hypothetical protein
MSSRTAPLWALDGKSMRVLSCAILALACGVPLYLRWLPMVDLPQYVALSRILVDLHDPRYDFATWYELAFERGPTLLPLALLGGLAKLGSVGLASRVVVCASVAAYPLGLCALLRALDKPVALALLGLPLVYASPFFQGLVPSSLSAGLALLLIALLCSPRSDRRARIALALAGGALPLTHPFGVLIATGFVACAAVTRRRSEPQLPWLWLAPLLLGALAWAVRAMFAQGVAAFNYPSPALRILRLPEQIIGGFVGRGEGYLLGALIVLWLLLRRRGAPWSRARFDELPWAERALFVFVVTCALGYAVLPGNTWSTSFVHSRAGWLAFALLPALMPAVDPRGLRGRAAALLLALGVATTWFANAQLSAFDAEARSFEHVLARVPDKPRTVSLMYDHRGLVAAGAPYLYFGAWAQAEHGGFLALSLIDTDWAVPLRRRWDAPAMLPVYGSEWDPTLIQVQPYQFEFYDTVLVHGKEPKEMTIFMDDRFRLSAQSGKWLLYTRQHKD